MFLSSRTEKIFARSKIRSTTWISTRKSLYIFSCIKLIFVQKTSSTLLCPRVAPHPKKDRQKFQLGFFYVSILKVFLSHLLSRCVTFFKLNYRFILYFREILSNSAEMIYDFQYSIFSLFLKSSESIIG